MIWPYLPILLNKQYVLPLNFQGISGIQLILSNFIFIDSHSSFSNNIYHVILFLINLLHKLKFISHKGVDSLKLGHTSFMLLSLKANSILEILETQYIFTKWNAFLMKGILFFKALQSFWRCPWKLASLADFLECKWRGLTRA